MGFIIEDVEIGSTFKKVKIKIPLYYKLRGKCFFSIFLTIINDSLVTTEVDAFLLLRFSREKLKRQ